MPFRSNIDIKDQACCSSSARITAVLAMKIGKKHKIHIHTDQRYMYYILKLSHNSKMIQYVLHLETVSPPQYSFETSAVLRKGLRGEQFQDGGEGVGQFWYVHNTTYADWGPPHLSLVVCYIFTNWYLFYANLDFTKDCNRNCKNRVLGVIIILGTSNQAITTC